MTSAEKFANRIKWMAENRASVDDPLSVEVKAGIVFLSFSDGSAIDFTIPKIYGTDNDSHLLEIEDSGWKMNY